MSGSAAVTYLLDTHGSDALHCLAVSNFMKNIVLYGFTFFANGMVLHRGVKTSLLVLASCQAFCWLASIPMYIYGKRVRSFVRTVQCSLGCIIADSFSARSHVIQNFSLLEGTAECRCFCVCASAEYETQLISNTSGKRDVLCSLVTLHAVCDSHLESV